MSEVRAPLSADLRPSNAGTRTTDIATQTDKILYLRAKVRWIPVLKPYPYVTFSKRRASTGVIVTCAASPVRGDKHPNRGAEHMQQLLSVVVTGPLGYQVSIRRTLLGQVLAEF